MFRSQQVVGAVLEQRHNHRKLGVNRLQRANLVNRQRAQPIGIKPDILLIVGAHQAHQPLQTQPSAVQVLTLIPLKLSLRQNQ